MKKKKVNLLSSQEFPNISKHFPITTHYCALVIGKWESAAFNKGTEQNKTIEASWKSARQSIFVHHSRLEDIGRNGEKFGGEIAWDTRPAVNLHVPTVQLSDCPTVQLSGCPSGLLEQKYFTSIENYLIGLIELQTVLRVRKSHAKPYQILTQFPNTKLSTKSGKVGVKIWLFGRQESKEARSGFPSFWGEPPINLMAECLRKGKCEWMTELTWIPTLTWAKQKGKRWNL